VPNLKPHGFQLATQLMIPEAQHFDALLREELISLPISGALIEKAVPAAVKFNRQLRDRAVEIEEVAAAGVLAAKFEIIEAMVAEQAPQALFGVGGFLAELTGEVAGGGGAGAVLAVLWRSPPHPHPLPRWGRGNFMRFVVWVHVRRARQRL